MAKGIPFPPEFRAEAVRLYRSGGRTINGVAREIGISTNALNRWIRQAEIDEGNKAGLTRKRGRCYLC